MTTARSSRPPSTGGWRSGGCGSGFCWRHAEVFLSDPDESAVVGQICNDRLEIQVVVGYVDGEKAVPGQFPHVKAQCLPRDEVARYRVGAEGVEHDQSIVPIGRSHQREAGVPGDNLHVRRTQLQEGEIAWIPGDPHHGGIDLVECEFLPALSIAGERTGT